MQFYTANSEQLRLHDTGGLSIGDTYISTDPGDDNVIIEGNVGIGTTGPGAKLEVYGGLDSIAGGIKVFGTNSDGVRLNMYANDGSNTASIYAYDDNDGGAGAYSKLYLGHSTGSQGIAVDSTGKVSIGTSAADQLLHLYGSNPQLKLESSVAYDSSPVVEISSSFKYNSGGSDTPFGKIVFGKENNTDGNTAGFLAFYKKPAGAVVAEAVRIDSSGNVGIGTTGPTSALHVGNGTGVPIITIDGGTNQSYLRFSKGGVIHWQLYGNSGNLTLGKTNNPGSGTWLTYDTDNNNIVVNSLRDFIAQGNVGIGTTNPTQNLHVVGQCMTGDTLLAVRRRKRKRNKKNKDKNLDDQDLGKLGITLKEKEIEYEYILVRIDQIQPGDEVLSLNEANNSAEYHKVRALMDMGVREIFELRTKSGRVIRTTANHPYLVKVKS